VKILCQVNNFNNNKILPVHFPGCKLLGCIFFYWLLDRFKKSEFHPAPESAKWKWKNPEAL